MPGNEKRDTSDPIRPSIPEFELDKPLFSPPKFSPYEERILRVLTVALRSLTTRQVAQYAGISYLGARRNLENLHANSYVARTDLGNRIYWRLPDKSDNSASDRSDNSESRKEASQ
ncbi:MAG: FaeA/PapI family transcriptional regulator [archaeon]